MSGPGSHRVVIAGGGFAALEAMIALRRLAGGRVELVLVSPTRDLAYPPLSVVEPFGLGEAPHFDLAAIAGDHGAELHVDAAAEVDLDRRVLRTRSDGEISYDSLLVTTGAEPREAVPGALTFRGSADRPAFEELLSDIDSGSVGKVVFAVPAGTAWPLPLYELALMTAARAESNDAPARFALVTAEEAPLSIFGRKASDAVASLLRERGIELRTSTVPIAFENGLLSVAPSDTVEADRVVAMPLLRGRSPAGLPHDEHGFLSTDEHGQVRACADVYAAGDVTTFPVKQGGIATQQADAAARAIAVRSGSPVEAEPFRPVLRGLLLTGDGARFMRSQIAGGHGDSSEVSPRMLWWPETKVAGQYLSHYLSRKIEPVQPVEPLPADAVPIEIDLTHAQSGT
jgi:sulfide:quinone oxidoreductase